MNRDMDTAVIYGVARIKEPNHIYFVPVMKTDGNSRELAFEWAASLAKLSHQKVVIYRNGVKLITIPAQ